jgi:hypothetical protein
MGQEKECRVDWGKQSSQGKALLETSEVLFRGDFRMKIPISSITGLNVQHGKLRIEFPGGWAIFHLGDAAEKWAARILNPPSRLDKLGVKPGAKVRLIGRHDADFRREIKERGAVSTRTSPDLTFIHIEAKDRLDALAGLNGGPVWVIYPKGVETITESEVRSAGLVAGMVDVKVCAFSATHTALKFTPRR